MRSRFVCLIGSVLVAGLPSLAVGASTTDVTVDGAKRYQTMEGFGTCLIAWVERFRSLYRTEEFQKIYIEGLGCNMLRVNMWGPTFAKPTEDWAQIRAEDFTMNADGGRPQIFLDFGRGIRQLVPPVLGPHQRYGKTLLDHRRWHRRPRLARPHSKGDWQCPS